MTGMFLVSSDISSTHVCTSFPRISIGFSSVVLITGFYRCGIQAIMKSKQNTEKKVKEEEEAKNELTVRELKGINSKLENDNKKLKDELRAAHILIEENLSGTNIDVVVCDTINVVTWGLWLYLCVL